MRPSISNPRLDAAASTPAAAPSRKRLRHHHRPMANVRSNGLGTLRGSAGDSINEPVPPSLTLTRAELEQLCETVQPKRFAEWLTARGWVFEPARGRRGFPKVDRAYYLARMSGQQPGTRRAGPRLEFMLQPR